jgi:hypothetical protein
MKYQQLILPLAILGCLIAVGITGEFSSSALNEPIQSDQGVKSQIQTSEELPTPPSELSGNQETLTFVEFGQLDLSKLPNDNESLGVTRTRARAGAQEPNVNFQSQGASDNYTGQLMLQQPGDNPNGFNGFLPPSNTGRTTTLRPAQLPAPGPVDEQGNSLDQSQGPLVPNQNGQGLMNWTVPMNQAAPGQVQGSTLPRTRSDLFSNGPIISQVAHAVVSLNAQPQPFTFHVGKHASSMSWKRGIDKSFGRSVIEPTTQFMTTFPEHSPLRSKSNNNALETIPSI